MKEEKNVQWKHWFALFYHLISIFVDDITAEGSNMLAIQKSVQEIRPEYFIHLSIIWEISLLKKKKLSSLRSALIWSVTWLLLNFA